MNPEKKKEGQKDKEEQVKMAPPDKKLLDRILQNYGDTGHKSDVPGPDNSKMKVKPAQFQPPKPKPTSNPVVSEFQNLSIKKGLGHGVAQSHERLGDKEAAGSSFGHMPSLGRGLMDKRTRMEQIQPPPSPGPQDLTTSVVSIGRGGKIFAALGEKPINPFNSDPDQGMKFGTVTVQGRGRGLGKIKTAAIHITPERMKQLAQAQQNMSSMSRSRDTENSGLSLFGCAEEYGLVFSAPPNKKGRLGADDAEGDGTQPKPVLPDKCDRERYQAAVLEELLEGFKNHK